MAGDPFPLFHLAPLTFALSDIPSLSSAQLALARFSSDYEAEDLTLENKLLRAFRQRRERNRAKIGTVPLGIFSPELSEDNPFPGFELLDLTFPLGNLEELTSAQLAVRSVSLTATCETLLTFPFATNSSYHSTLSARERFCRMLKM